MCNVRSFYVIDCTNWMNLFNTTSLVAVLHSAIQHQQHDEKSVYAVPLRPWNFFDLTMWTSLLTRQLVETSSKENTYVFYLSCSQVYIICQGRRHGFEIGGGTILRAERAKNFFDPPTLFGQWGGDKILLRYKSA